MENKRLFKDKVFFAIVKIVFFVIYGYFDPAGTISSYALEIRHTKLKKCPKGTEILNREPSAPEGAGLKKPVD